MAAGTEPPIERVRFVFWPTEADHTAVAFAYEEELPRPGEETAGRPPPWRGQSVWAYFNVNREELLQRGLSRWLRPALQRMKARKFVPYWGFKWFHAPARRAVELHYDHSKQRHAALFGDGEAPPIGLSEAERKRLSELYATYGAGEDDPALLAEPPAPAADPAGPAGSVLDPRRGPQT